METHPQGPVSEEQPHSAPNLPRSNLIHRDLPPRSNLIQPRTCQGATTATYPQEATFIHSDLSQKSKPSPCSVLSPLSNHIHSELFPRSDLPYSTNFPRISLIHSDLSLKSSFSLAHTFQGVISSTETSLRVAASHQHPLSQE